MNEYYIVHLDRGMVYDFSKKNYIVRAENIDNLRRNLIQKYVRTTPISKKPIVYDGLIRIYDGPKVSRYIGTLLFDEKANGRAYWMKAGEFDFYYPVSAKTGRISGEGWDYFRPHSKKRKA